MAVLASLTQAASFSENRFLEQLKDIRNGIIGNDQRKMEMVEEDGTIQYLVQQTHDVSRTLYDGTTGGKLDDKVELSKLEILKELAVILGAVANVGAPTLPTLLYAKTAIILLASMSMIHPMALSNHTAHPNISRYIYTKCLPSVTRALRNHAISLGDYVWGHMWGVGVDVPVEKAEDTVGIRNGKGKESMGGAMEVDGKENGGEMPRDEGSVRKQAVEVLMGIFQPRALSIYAPILLEPSSPLSLLPLYQMLSHLTVMSWQRQAIIAAAVPPNYPIETPPGQIQPLIRCLTNIIGARESNQKLQQAALGCLGALCRDDEVLAEEALGAIGAKTEGYKKQDTPFWADLIHSRSPGIAVSAACCATQIIYSIPAISNSRFRVFRDKMALFDTLVNLLDQNVEEKTEICFVISYLLTDEIDLQQEACDSGALIKIIAIAKSIETDSSIKSEAESVKAKLLEGCFLAMTSLAFYHESPKAAIAEANMLSVIRKHLKHQSYGVRAAACQVTRALSRSPAILRTTLVDSGIATEILELLKTETAKYSQSSKEEEGFVAASRNGRKDTVLIAASAALCNLITEYSPMQLNMIDSGGIELLVRMCDFPSQGVRINALWSLRNMLYKSEFRLKTRVMEALTWPGLQKNIQDPSPEVQEQGLALLRNICCEGSEEEIELVYNGLGETALFAILERQLESADVDCLEQAMYVLYNLCLGNEKHRESVMSRSGILEGMIHALDHDLSIIKVPAIGCFTNLVEVNDRQRRPRHDLIARLKPFNLEPKLVLMTNDPIYDVRDKSTRLLQHFQTPGGGR